MRWFGLFAAAQAAAAAVLGLDFGSDLTKASLVAPNIPFEVVLSPDSKRKDASGLVLKPAGGDALERVYGGAGLALTSRFPGAALYHLKALLGLGPTDEAARAWEGLHPGLELVATERQTVAVRVGKTEYPVEEVVAMGFADVRGRADELLRAKFGAGRVRDAALTVPGHFGAAQRRALADAADLAGLELIALVSDGVAVATNYASTRTFGADKQYFVVYDMGAGSTTSTLLAVWQEDGQTFLDVAGFAAAPQLGGEQLTARLRDLLVDRFAAQAKLSSAEVRTPRVLARLWREAERAKAVLSANSEVSVHVESVAHDRDLRTKVARAEFEALAADLVAEVARPLRESLTTFTGEAVPVAALDAVVLAGGATRTPFVQAEIRAVVGDILSKNVNADEAAVLGATLRGVGISGIFKSKAINVTDRTAAAYTLRVDGGAPEELFPRGAALNTRQVVEIAPTAENVTLQVLENGADVVTWTLPLVGDALRTLRESTSDACVAEPVVEATVELTHSGLVHLAEVVALCRGEEAETRESKAAREAWKRQADAAAAKAEADGDDTQTPLAPEPAPVVAPRRLTRYLSSRPRYAGAAPLSQAAKQQSLYHMKALDKADADRVRKQTLHNELESLLYRVREAAPGDAEAAALLEWLDETRDATVVQLSERIKTAKGLMKKALAAAGQGDADADADAGADAAADAGADAGAPADADDADEPASTATATASDAAAKASGAAAALLKVLADAGVAANPGGADWLINALTEATAEQLARVRAALPKAPGLGEYRAMLEKLADAVDSDEDFKEEL